ncbi:MAG TPA: OmpH family outer membrane protein [Gammaproteobacteria bacterium]|nr:OmpH family outer membrane protein [Gammaproteobacteria bacterium]
MKKVLAIVSSVLLVSGMQAYAAPATATTTTTTAPAPVLAVVNVQQIFQQSPKIADLNKKLQSQFKGRQEKLIAAQKSFQDEVDKFRKDAPTMSQKDKDAAQKKITDDQASLSKDAGVFQQDLSKEQNKIMKSVLGQLNEIISSISKKNNYTLVLDSQAVVYASDSADITKQVASAFDK